MNNLIYRFTFVFVALSFLAITGCTSGNQNPGNITTDVANKLTENITFDNGTFVSGAKPAENTASELKLLSVVMPDTIEFGKKFDIELYTDYAGGEVEGAVMYVPPANVGYVQITASLEVTVTGVLLRPAVLGNGGKYVMHLSATIQENALYAGKIPKLEFALYKNLAGGIAVGNYASHETKLPDAPDGGDIKDAGVPTGVYTIGLGNDGGTIYIGGAYTNIGGQVRNNIAAIDAVTGTATSWNPNANGRVNFITGPTSRNFVGVGGSFTSIGGQVKQGGASIDVTTGTVADCNMDCNGIINIFAANKGSDTIYIGGSFSSFSGKERKNIAAINGTSCTVTDWNPGADGVINTIVTTSDGNTVYVGGKFKTIGGQARNNIAAIDQTTGLVTSWNPDANGNIYVLFYFDSIYGGRLVVGGDFTTIAGQTRNRLAAFETTTSNLIGSDPQLDGPVLTVSLSKDGNTGYFGGKFTTIAGQTRNHLAAIDMSGNVLAWNPGTDDVVRTIIVSKDDKTVYVGGEFTNIGGQARNNIAAIDATTGLATGWNPNVR